MDAKDKKAKTMKPWPTTTMTWPKTTMPTVNNHDAVAKDHNTSAEKTYNPCFIITYYCVQGPTCVKMVMKYYLIESMTRIHLYTMFLVWSHAF